MQEETGAGAGMSLTVEDSIDVPSNKNHRRSKFVSMTPVDETNMISFEDQSGLVMTDLPQFMRNANRAA